MKCKEDVIEFHKVINGRVVARFALSEAGAEEVDVLLTQKGDEITQRGNRKRVVVIGEINAEIYEQRQRTYPAQPVEPGQKFASAMEASRHLGYKYNEVKQALNRAKHQGEEVAIVAGVPFQYLDTLSGIH